MSPRHEDRDIRRARWPTTKQANARFDVPEAVESAAPLPNECSGTAHPACKGLHRSPTMTLMCRRARSTAPTT